jgi:hypothetical protein
MKNVFVNDDIFLSEGDYVIGGFQTEKEGDFKYADFHLELINRTSRLIDDYLVRASNYNLKLGLQNPKEAANEQLALVVCDNLKIQPPYYDKTSVMETIMSSYQVDRWLVNIYDNIENYPEYQSSLGGITNNSKKVSAEKLLIATECTNATFEQFIEQLSLIEN